MEEKIIEILKGYQQFNPQEGQIVSADWFPDIAEDIQQLFDPKTNNKESLSTCLKH